MVKKRKKILAAVLAAAVAVTGLPMTQLYAEAAPEEGMTREAADTPVLELKFEDNLNDTSPKQTQVKAMTGPEKGPFTEKADLKYETGVNGGKALSFDGTTYLDLGTDDALSPSQMTVSFWLNPGDTAMSGEEVIAWSKRAWDDANGWYLTSNGDNAPLKFYVGGGDENCFVVSVPRSEFFPVNTWTHIAVTYDSITKKALIYRNGIQQAATRSGAGGTINPNPGVMKSIGWNGEEYKKPSLKVMLDEYRLYDKVLSAESIINTYKSEGGTWDGTEDVSAIVQKDLDDLKISAITARDLALPIKGDNGCTIRWSANSSEYLADDGRLLKRPGQGEADAEVTMTASVSYAGETPKTKDFKVMVKALKEGEDPSLVLDLKFDGDNLNDTSIYEHEVTANGTVSYEAGIDGKGKAVSMAGSTYLNLGTDGMLSPSKLSLSFWINPGSGLTGECPITWSKKAYNSNGWYLSSKSDTEPLVLSVGFSTGQPYEVVVSGKRSEFFPAGEWTHILVTYDSDTKEAVIYKNGIDQRATARNTGSEGIIRPCYGDEKSIGYNGPEYHSTYLKASLDEYRLYDRVLKHEEVINVYDESSGRTFNRLEAAQKDVNALEVPDTVKDDFTLSGKGGLGSVITWRSSDTSISVNGTACTVTRPGYGEEDKVVTLTATAVFAGATAATKEFEVTVEAKKADLSGLNQAIEDAGKFAEKDYTPNSYQVLKTALEAAQRVIANKASTQEEADAAKEALESAIGSLAERADKTDLAKAIANAKAEDEDLYTSESWSDMQAALTEAERVNEDANAAQEDVDEACSALNAALANLVESNAEGTVNKKGLAKAIAEAEAKDEVLYTPASWSNMQAALTEAKRVNEDENATQAEVTAARQSLASATNSLKVRADKKALAAVIETAGNKLQDDYTAESWSNMQTALTEAKRVNEDGNASSEEVDAAKKELEDAIAALLEKALVLDLKFEDNLTDASANAFAVTGSKEAAYVSGVDEKGKAVSLDGSTYLNLGTDGKLSPAKLSLSFWIKPNQDMKDTGEQIITWNKKAFNSDGWYLTSNNDKEPIGLSVGPATGGDNAQPYFIKVDGDRSKFFPQNEWTHIVVTYDSDTKEAAIYRNGIPQKTSVKYALSNTATGIIGPCDGDMKVIGSNGPNYKHGAKLKAALDEYRLYDKVLGQEDVIEEYKKSGRSFDKRAVAQSDLEALNIPDMVTGKMILPGKGESSSVITWTSSDTAIVVEGTEGIVTRPEIGQPDKTVRLTAKAVFAGGEEADKTFTVTVKAKVEKSQDGVLDCGIENVTLADSYLMHAAQKENEYLLSLNSKKFLYEFYRVSGLTPPTEEGYQGWERSNGSNFRGHTFGHYMSALSQAYKGAKDDGTKAQLLTQIRDAVEGLKECQNAYASAHPESAGYVSAFRESILNKVDGSGSSDENVIVPWYNLHKVLAGLIDIYTFVDDKELAEEALGIAEGFGEYVFNRCSKLTDNTVMLRTEYGGMNEALYELYDITGNTHFKAAAEYFDEVALFNELAAGHDVLNGKHANTTIPKLIGALKRYTVLTENEDYYDALTEAEKTGLEKYKTAAENFWDIVIGHHTYITGGNSQSEHFHEADKLCYDATKGDYDGASTCETCNTYNMLKLSRELYKLTKDKKYMDYYENTYINAILSSQNPETGTTMYFQPMAPGYNKVFNRPFDEFWCCTGTGMENFSKLGDTMYFTEQSDVYVNMYFSNTYDFAKQNLRLTQTAKIPNEDEVTVSVAAMDGTEVAAGTNLKFRIPDWVAGEAVILVNGEKLAIQDNTENGYVTVSGVKAGDIIKLTFPMEVKAYATQDNKDFVAFRFGPVALSAALGTNNIEASSPNGILVRVGTKDTTCQSAITVQNMSVDEWMDNVKENLVRIEDSEDGKVQFKLKNTDSSDLTYTPHFMRYKERYGLYMTFEEAGSEASQKRIRDRKERLREEEMAIDTLTNFDENNSEFAKNLNYKDSNTGSFNGRLYRDAQKTGWFSYDLQVNPEAGKNYLLCTWYSGDNNRTFELYINGEKLQDVTITNAAGANQFYTDTIEIPAKYWSAPEYKKDSTGEFVLDTEGNKIPVINVKFQGNGSSFVGGLYGIATADSTEYSHDPNLSSLSFDKGKLTPEFQGETKNYTLKVPSITQDVTMMVSPNTPSGLIFIDDILVDDSIGRRIILTGGSTEITFQASAQDHETLADYTVTIVKSTVDVSGLAGKMEEAEKIEKGNYSDESYQAFLKALEDVRKVVNDADSTEAQVNAAQKALAEAIANLKEKGPEAPVQPKTDFTALNKTIADAKKYKAANYTAASFKALQDALGNAEKIAKNPQAAQTQVNAADTALKNAIGKLVKLKVASTKKVTLGVKETYSVAAKGYTYTTSNKKVATVSKKGKVTAKKTGKATIKAANKAGKVKVYNITVKKAPKKILKVTPSKKTLKKGKKVTLKVKLPKGTAGKCTFKSNNKKVATVTSKGVVKAKKKGTAKITVKTYNNKKKVVTIKVR